MKSLNFYKRNFFNTAVADIYRAIDGKSHIGSFILTFCLIDYLVWLEGGRPKAGKSKRAYGEWVKKRLLPIDIFYTGKEEELYGVRCALVHNYGPMDPEFHGYQLNFEATGMHLQRVNNPVLKLCLYTMLTEVVYTAHQFFNELEKSQNKGIIDRLSQQIQITHAQPPVLYADMHRALSVFDEGGDVSLNDIRSNYSMKILWA